MDDAETDVLMIQVGSWCRRTPLATSQAGGTAVHLVFSLRELLVRRALKIGRAGAVKRMM